MVKIRFCRLSILHVGNIQQKETGGQIFPSRQSVVEVYNLDGVLGTMGYQLLFMNGMLWTAAGDGSLIIPLNTVFTVLLAYPMLGQRVT